MRSLLYKILPGAVDSIHKVVLERLEPFSSPGKPLAQTLHPRDDSVWVNESSEPDVLTVNGLQRHEHRRTGSDLFGCSSGDKEPHHFELSTVISGRRIAPAVYRPSQRRRFVLFIFQVRIDALNQSPCQPIFTEQCCPMECGLSEQSTSCWFCSRIQEPEPNFFSSQARRADKRVSPSPFRWKSTSAPA